MILHAEALSANGNHLDVMKQAIQQCGGKDLIIEKRPPFGKAGIGGQDDGPLLIAISHECKEGLRLFQRELGVADLVNDEEPGSQIATQALSSQARMRHACQISRHAGQGGEEDRVVGFQRLDRKAESEVGFSPSIEMPP